MGVSMNECNICCENQWYGIIGKRQQKVKTKEGGRNRRTNGGDCTLRLFYFLSFFLFLACKILYT